MGIEELARMYLRQAREVVEMARRNPSSVRYDEVRYAAWLLEIGEEGVKEVLLKIAREYGGCASCRHSVPVPFHLSLMARWCSLGLRQDDCGRWEPLA
ncbi:MAG: hypothetical protein QXH81_09630 [Thermofilaceae archaeon]